eukprot:TRINITY_DN9023_c3_g1_i2.p2 TRINITY_DN9023_c3_g1~~TRINITY_DN9023_c3_g1_i2.p2  ORF type:complete len:198 (-),score=20.24 TRINITY_DN9023_c3_g1_i2:183-776(-)
MVRKGKRVLGEDDNKVQNTENIDIDDIALEDDGTETDGEGGSNKESRVMFIGGIPHGFYEQQIRKYFGQFGVVKKVRLSRRPKDLGCRGYGFVQFAYPSVAKIAAEAMDGYFMFKQRLRDTTRGLNYGKDRDQEFIRRKNLYPDQRNGNQGRKILIMIILVESNQRSQELNMSTLLSKIQYCKNKSRGDQKKNKIKR